MFPTHARMCVCAHTRTHTHTHTHTHTDTDTDRGTPGAYKGRSAHNLFLVILTHNLDDNLTWFFAIAYGTLLGATQPWA